MACICPLVEGDIDAAVALRLIEHAGHVSGTVYGRKGCTYIKKKISGFNLSARGTRYLAMVDLMDTGLPCPSQVIHDWVPHREPSMHFRIVVREIESWLLGDIDAMSEFLHVPRARFVATPESLPDPKQAVINLARQSHRASIRAALVPVAGSSAAVGPTYNTEMSAFIQSTWNPNRARALCPSLDRCMRRLSEIRE